ncbi:unnamed protein product [Closterium sp. NIES-53]
MAGGNQKEFCLALPWQILGGFAGSGGAVGGTAAAAAAATSAAGDAAAGVDGGVVDKIRRKKEEGLGYNLLSVSQLMAKGIHLKEDSTTQEFKLYHGKGGLYIGKAVMKNNVFVLDFVPDLGTADSDGIVTFTSWTHPPDLDPDFSPEGFWYSHTIPEAERTRALATIQHSAAAETTSAATETTSAAAKTTSETVKTTAAAAAAAAATSTPIAGPSTAPVPIDGTPPTLAQQLNPTSREVHRSANLTASFYSNSDLYRRSPGHRASEDIWHARMGHPSNTVLNNTIKAGVLDKDSLLLTDGSKLRRARGTCFTCPEAELPHRPFTSHHNPSAPTYAPLEKVYSDILYNREPGQGAYSYTITFIDAATRYVWHLNLPSKDMAFEAFIAWLLVAERESGVKLKSFQNYNAWKIFDVHSKETVAARDVIFYERLTLPTYLANLTEDRDPTGGFHGDRAFASAPDEAEWDEQNVDNASEEAGPLPYCSVPIPMDDENPRESVNAETYFNFADTDYVTPAEVNTDEAECIGPNFIPDPETGDEAAYPADTTLPRYTQIGLQILGLVTVVHGIEAPKEPATVQQALGGEHREKWREAMDKELKALKERNTWKVVPIGVARNKTILTGKWVFRVKTKADGTIDNFKARWVVRGFDQEQGRDFTETFAPVSRHTSLRILLAIAAMKKKKQRQIDVANAFLYAPVDAEIYVVLPHGELQKDLTLTVSSTVTQYLAVDFEVWLDDLQLFLQCDSKDGLSLFDLTSGASTAPAADADSTVRSQWTTRDAAARLAVRSHLPSTERAHFSQYKSAKTLYDAVVTRYSSPATAALSQLMLPYLFPDLAAFATVADLITHLRTSDTRYRAALPAEFCAKKPPPPHVHHPLLPSHPTP